MNFLSRAPTTTANRTSAGKPSGGVASNVVQATFAQNNSEFDIVDTYKKFPDWVEMLSGPAAQGGMQIPDDLANYVGCFKTSATMAFICYVHEQSSRVRNYVHTMRNELASQSIQVSQTLLVTELVLIEARKSAHARKITSTNSSFSKYESVELFRSWIQNAQRLKCTDVHMRVLEGGRGEVLARIDGELEPLEGTKNGLSDTQVLQAMKAAYETLADRGSNSDGTFSETKSMSCMIAGGLGIPNLRLRFASQRGFYGPKAVLRLLSSDINKPSMLFEEMGFAKSQVELLEKSQRMDNGIVLQTGVTGSGKTTAAKTLLDTHPHKKTSSIYQVADPIEYVIKGVHQINVQRNIMTLAEAGKKDAYSEVIETLMRMDPDIVDVGEIRDLISARAAANVAKSGHLAMGTLHANAIAGIFNRLTDPKIGLDRSELASGSLRFLLCYQALSPILCGCAFTPAAAISDLKQRGDEREAAYLGRLFRSAQKLPFNTDRIRFKNSEGCQECRGRGTNGLTIVAEVMIPDDDWLDLSLAGKDRQAWNHYRKEYSDKNYESENMTGKSVLEHALFKAHEGKIDLRQVDRFGSLEDYEVLK